jgi:hypothetical protein
MSYTKEKGIEFWFQFDDRFLFNPTIEIRQLYGQIQGPDTIRFAWEQARQAGTYPAAFEASIQSMHTALVRLSELQFEVMEAHFTDDLDSLRYAFEDFGQGVLFDDRRNPGDKIHKMDTGGPLNPPIGYHRWHPIIRASVIAGGNASLWLEINRFVGLAWAIQSDAKPIEDAPDNPPLAAQRLEELRAIWLNADAEALDRAFDSSPYPSSEFLP